MNKICKALLKVFVIAFLANAALFAVFFFDLDGICCSTWWSPS